MAGTLRTKVDIAVAVCVATFVAVLAISAYWDPSIRILHALEAIPYALAAALCLRGKTFGYALGAASGAFWLWMAGLLTTFVRNGFDRVEMLIRTGTVDRVDQLIAAPAAIATGGLVLFCCLGYLGRSGKSWGDLASWAVALAGVPLFFLVIIAAFAPQYLPILQRAF
jgi:hypothetical protein